MIVRNGVWKNKSSEISARGDNYMITFENVTKKYDEDSGLRDVSFHIEDRKSVV